MSNQVKHKKILILGGGLSGLLCAFELVKKNYDITLWEKSENLGGIIQSFDLDKLKIDLGAESFSSRSNVIPEILNYLGEKNRLVKPRSISSWMGFNDIDKKIFKMPKNTIFAIPANYFNASIFRILSFKGFLSVFRDINFLGLNSLKIDNKDESIFLVLEKRLGVEIVDKIIKPLIIGIYRKEPNWNQIFNSIPGFEETLTSKKTIHKTVSFLLKNSTNSTPGNNVSGIDGGIFNIINFLEDFLKKRISIKKNVNNILIVKTIDNNWGIKHDKIKTPQTFDEIILTLPPEDSFEILKSLESKNKIPAELTKGDDLKIFYLIVKNRKLNKEYLGSGVIIGEFFPTSNSNFKLTAVTNSSSKWNWIKNDVHQKYDVNTHYMRIYYKEKNNPTNEDIHLKNVCEDLSLLYKFKISEKDIIAFHSNNFSQVNLHMNSKESFDEYLQEFNGLNLIGGWLNGSGITPIATYIKKYIDSNY